MISNDLPFAAESTRSRAAQSAWRDRPLAERLRPLAELRHRLVERADDLAADVHADVNRSPGEVIATDILPVAAALQWLGRQAESTLKPVTAGKPPLWLMGCRDVIHRRPHGVVGIVGTWNYPIFLNAIPIAHALAAGNGVLWKPSEQTPRTANLLHELFLDSGIPAELFQRLPATREAGPMLAEADVDLVQFTGSDAVGRQLAKRLGERLIPSILELSGVDACLILPDADPAFAAKAVWFGVSLNAGQTCLAVRRVFVHRDVAEAFIAALAPIVAAGPATAPVLPGQRAAWQAMIDEAKASGSRVLLRDGPEPGAAIVIEASADHAVNRVACFAPIAAVRSFDTVDAMVEAHNASDFGLACSIFAGDAAAAAALAPRLRCGSVVVNDVIAPAAHPGTPFGGRGASGWGSTQGADGLLAMTVPQVVTVRSGTFRPHYETSPQNDAIVRGFLEATHGRSWWGRTKAKLRTLKAMLAGR
jgi:acyl-CoA reductase-like NAD-dependent aldehyde dehydrogenase